ncbi:MAG: hypothetical protein SP1CHLAM54_03950 [Chlamydiia bacterium]|nr:hypothetical protein [Chlamydiia bacterium]MCH9615310.1 hypothetical protein [Chlamydiia bacterium]MCH9628368.1 hypothetical protein [Chlamydiia bacterium]
MVDLTLSNFTAFHVAALILFSLAVCHTFLASWFTRISQNIAQKNNHPDQPKNFFGEILHFLGEVEVVFGIWVVPLLILIVSFYNWETAVNYINTRNYVEPIFVVIIMTLAATRPLVVLAEHVLHFFAKLLGNTVGTWWLSILTLGPILGSFITEPGAMTLSAMMLAHKFYDLNPSKKLAYATLGILFVNVSVGGVLTNFAAPPVLIISHTWDWSSLYMMTHFGWKAILGILVVNITFFLYFRKEFKALNSNTRIDTEKGKESVPWWITLVHIVLLFWLVFNAHDVPIFIGSFLLFLGFHQATSYHQYPLNLKQPLLVGFFLAGLVIHGGLQGWWIIPLLENMGCASLMIGGTVLTAFNDNAAVVYLSSLVPNLTDMTKQAVVSGVLTGGGLTVIANAPNPAGQSILKKYFQNAVSPWYLFIGALIPTVVFFLIFYLSLIV